LQQITAQVAVEVQAALEPMELGLQAVRGDLVTLQVLQVLQLVTLAAVEAAGHSLEQPLERQHLVVAQVKQLVRQVMELLALMG
jgi:hypothetical protein